jgi:amino acid transporter
MQGLNIRKILIGAPLATHMAVHQRLTKVKALAVFSSDALSSSAYATEAILLVLIAAGAGALSLSLPIALGIAALLLIVSFSYYQTIHAYPSGGGAYIVAKENLGTMPGLMAAGSLLIDYTLTVAVSVSAGVAALTSAFPALTDFRVPLALVIVAFITLVNLRGVRESGTFFAIPTYAFVIGIMGMIAFGLFRIFVLHDVPTPEEHQVVVANTTEAAQGLTLFLILRAFAAGCTALTGVEAISNGIPAFEKPESDNAGKTLVAMVVMLVVMFVGITFLANYFPIEVGGEHGATVLSQINGEIFGEGSILYYYVQIATLLILSLAANTAFADFPRLASLIAQDRYLPRQLTNWGDRLVYSNGIIVLAALSGVLIILFRADEHNLLPLYAVGVFISFTLSQSGMVVHWLKERAKPDFKQDTAWLFKVAVNGFGALCTVVVGIILMVTKFFEGAWIVMISIPVLIVMFRAIHNHYVVVAKSLTLDGIAPRQLKLPNEERTDIPIIVLMNSLNRSSLQALEYALRTSDNVRVCAVETDPAAIDRLSQRWVEWKLEDIPLDILESPFREIGRPLLNYLHEYDDGPVPAMVMLPQFVVKTWWHRLLHNGTTSTIRDVLYQDNLSRGHGRPVILVPYRIGTELYEPELVGTLKVTNQPDIGEPRKTDRPAEE